MTDDHKIKFDSPEDRTVLSRSLSTYMRVRREVRYFLGPQLIPDDVLAERGIETNDEIANKLALEEMRKVTK